MRTIAYHRESETVAQRYAASRHAHAGEQLLPVGSLPTAAAADEIVIVGRGGNTHHADIEHTRAVLTARGLRGEDISLVCFDWHHDVDNSLDGTELTPGSWVFYGLEHDVFANAYIIGANPAIDHEIDPVTGEMLWEDQMVLRMSDRLRLYTARSGPVCLQYRPALEPHLAGNPSVARYETSGSSVAVTYREWTEVDYSDLLPRAFVSIDVDVLAESEVTSDCPQGVWTLDHLLRAMGRARASADIVGWSVCGMDLGDINERSYATLSAIIGACGGSGGGT